MKTIRSLLLLCTVVVLTMTSSAAAGDVSQGAWHHDAIAFCVESGLMMGRDSGFCPDEPVTLAELAVAMNRLHSLLQSGSPITWDFNPAYLEIEATPYNMWFVHSAQQLSLWGFSPDTYAPLGYDQPAARMDVIKILKRILDYDLSAIADVDDIPDVAEDGECYSFLLSLYRAGIIKGKGGNIFCPNDSLTRAELAAILSRVSACVSS